MSEANVMSGLPPGVMGRAGVLKEVPAGALAERLGVTAGFHLPDFSEFQPNINWPQVISENGGAAVVRAMYGSNHVDNAWVAGRRAAAHAAGIQLLGIYQYLRADQDAVAQARALANLVGTLQHGEFLVLDHEEGGGNQLARANAWLATVANVVPAYPSYGGAWLYSGLNFAMTSGLTPIFNGNKTHTWVAAYGGGEPVLGHSLWQHSNGQIGNCTYEPWRGAGFVDCSSHGGTFADLTTLVTGGTSSSTGSGKGEAMSQLNNGYGVQTLINFGGGTAGGIQFGCNASEVGQNSPWIKVAIGLPDGSWARSRIRIPADTTQNDGTAFVDFPNSGDGVKMVSVIRDSNGAADNVAVGWHLY